VKQLEPSELALPGAWLSRVRPLEHTLVLRTCWSRDFLDSFSTRQRLWAWNQITLVLLWRI